MKRIKLDKVMAYIVYYGGGLAIMLACLCVFLRFMSNLLAMV